MAFQPGLGRRGSCAEQGKFLLFHIEYRSTYSDAKFLKQFNVTQTNPSAKCVRVHKAPATYKATRPNIDNTDSEDDTDSCEATAVPTNTGMDEWKAYINTIEDIPDGMSIVRWWGV